LTFTNDYFYKTQLLLSLASTSNLFLLVSYVKSSTTAKQTCKASSSSSFSSSSSLNPFLSYFSLLNLMALFDLIVDFFFGPLHQKILAR